MRRFDSTKIERAGIAQIAYNIHLPNCYKDKYAAFCPNCIEHWTLTRGDSLQICMLFQGPVPSAPAGRRFHYLLSAICPKCLKPMTIWDSRYIAKTGSICDVMSPWELLKDTIEETPTGMSITTIIEELVSNIKDHNR
jgi:hypothetical protein